MYQIKKNKNKNKSKNKNKMSRNYCVSCKIHTYCLSEPCNGCQGCLNKDNICWNCENNPNPTTDFAVLNIIIPPSDHDNKNIREK